MELCNHRRNKEERGTPGCTFWQQGFKDCGDKQPKKERSYFKSDEEFACYESGCRQYAQDFQTGRDLAAFLFGPKQH